MRNIKVWVCVACLATSLAAPAQEPAPLTLDIIDMAAISRMSPRQLEALAEGLAAQEIMRTKRSSAQALSLVTKGSSGLQSSVGLLGQASAGVLSLAASASSKTGAGDEHGYSYEPQESKVDFWGLKKSILYTLLQAVKAITGGVTILKGQLIKGGGALASSVGKVISVKGEAVSNLGKKIVSSAALSAKKPLSTPVYGPPPPTHLDYPPSAYGAPTAPAHFTHTAPSIPTGYAAHKYPAHLDGQGVLVHQNILQNVDQNVPIIYRRIGRAKLNGVHAGLVLLTPLNDGIPSETHPEPHHDTHHEPPHVGSTPLEPPPSILHSAFSAIKNVFTPTGPSDTEIHHPPPPPQPVPPFKPMVWGAVNSYGEPAMLESYSDYNPHHSHPTLDYALSKTAVVPSARKPHGLTPDKIQKITHNLNKLAVYMNENIQRSSEELPKLTGMDAYREMLSKGLVPLFPTPVITDNEIGVLPADLLPAEPITTTTTTTTTIKPKTTTESEKNRRKDVRYILRGNKIVQV